MLCSKNYLSLQSTCQYFEILVSNQKQGTWIFAAYSYSTNVLLLQNEEANLAE
ncbi:hypothetical protein ACJX0J_032235, partial [Zea mays]